MELKQLPKSLHDITLEKWVEWHELYGNDINKQKPQGEEAVLLFQDDLYCKHYSHYSDTPLTNVIALLITDIDKAVEVIKESVLSHASIFRETLAIDQLDLVYTEFDFLGFKWKIQSPLSVADAKLMTVEEFEHSQDIALILSDLQDGSIKALYELCMEYLVSTEGDKLTIDIVKSLPLYIALCVKRYVEETINLYIALSSDRIANTA